MIDWNKINGGFLAPDRIPFETRNAYEMIEELQKENNKLQSNWNSLREYTEERLKVLERRINTFGTINPDKDTKVLQIYQNVLDKMNELESGEK